MTAFNLLQQLHARGVILTPSPDGTIRCHAPKGVLTEDVRQAIRQHKQALLALLVQPASDAAATEPSTQEACTSQERIPPPPPPYPGHAVGAPFCPGYQVWLYRWDDQSPRFDAPVTIVQMRTLWAGEQDIGWWNAAGAVTWHHARLAVAVEAQEGLRQPQQII